MTTKKLAAKGRKRSKPTFKTAFEKFCVDVGKVCGDIVRVWASMSKGQRKLFVLIAIFVLSPSPQIQTKIMQLIFSLGRGIQ